MIKMRDFRLICMESRWYKKDAGGIWTHTPEMEIILSFDEMIRLNHSATASYLNIPFRNTHERELLQFYNSFLKYIKTHLVSET